VKAVYYRLSIMALRSWWRSAGRYLWARYQAAFLGRLPSQLESGWFWRRLRSGLRNGYQQATSGGWRMRRRRALAATPGAGVHRWHRCALALVVRGHVRRGGIMVLPLWRRGVGAGRPLLLGSAPYISTLLYSTVACLPSGYAMILACDSFWFAAARRQNLVDAVLRRFAHATVWLLAAFPFYGRGFYPGQGRLVAPSPNAAPATSVFSPPKATARNIPAPKPGAQAHHFFLSTAIRVSPLPLPLSQAGHCWPFPPPVLALLPGLSLAAERALFSLDEYSDACETKSENRSHGDALFPPAVTADANHLSVLLLCCCFCWRAVAALGGSSSYRPGGAFSLSATVATLRACGQRLSRRRLYAILHSAARWLHVSG